MSNWDNISLFKFQQVDALINNKNLSDIDKTLFATCAIFDMTEYELDNAGLKKANRLMSKAAGIFSTELKPPPQKRIGRYFINYDAAALTFGQYIEIAFFLSGSPVQNAHYVLASISHTWMKKNKATDHKKKADYFLYQPVGKVIGSLNLFMQRFKSFNEEYRSLFGLDKETNGNAGNDFFNRRYGWIYSASQVAEYERITLDQAFALPVRQAFNDLGYLKAKGKYEAELLKKN